MENLCTHLEWVHHSQIRLFILLKFKNWIGKDGFLPRRDQYSYQLKNYLEFNSLQPNSTCMIYFSDNLNKLEKEASKILGKYRKSKNVVVQKIELDKFSFKKPEE